MRNISIGEVINCFIIIFHCAGDSRDVRLPIRIQKAAETLLTGTKEFTFMATLQQEERNAGTILAFSKGPQRYSRLHFSCQFLLVYLNF